ncbi:MAG: YqhA family protein [Chloroflexi bacterium]|nr:YqhA family protein [Chloroflexota bacterium]MCC6895596.1 YqhA family protein [Anaerolineae bacterium]
MKKLLESSKYLMLILVFASFVATIASLVWSIYETVYVVYNLFIEYKGASNTITSLAQLMDIFLLVAVLYIFTVSIYELFIGELDMPEWLQIHSFDELKTLLSNLVVLIGGISFLKYFLERNDPTSTFFYGAAIAVVSYVLILYRNHGHSDKPH